ncbi:unnamed protein product [Ranitomeya imitator]|uniref:Reverse transcriptase domain-containing protein n=1 Tax=Ranitomeya imitator TaxID=111125 RepID=A0ABN9KSY1_9NEOB|nr:unnamed protein product [Ranitomeya imitator]
MDASAMTTAVLHKVRTASHIPLRPPGRSYVAKRASGFILSHGKSSPQQLSTDQIEVLSMGLTFSPVASFDYFTALKDLHLFARKLVLKKLHDKPSTASEWSTQEQETIAILEELSNETPTPTVSNFTIPKPKKFPPLSLYPDIDLFVRLVTEEFRRIPTGIQHDNLTRRQREAIKELKSLDNVVIKPSDKGGNIVLWPCSMYEKEASRQLKDSSCYKRLTFNPTFIYQNQLRDMVEQAFYNGTISKETMDGLIPETPRTPCLYLLPKVHKSTTHPPGRPIVSGGGGLCEQINKFLDFHLKPMVESLPSYIQDTGDVLRKLADIPLETDMWMVTLDVESLYTSIRHSDGIEAARYFLHMSTNDNDLIEFLLSLLEFALTHNFFMFKEVLYLQLQGTAMGAAFAPSYANLFMGSWERAIFLTDVIPLIEKVCTWVRFIDDIFVIWQGSETDLTSFIQLLNDNSLNIKLTCKYSQTNIDFLDTKIFKGEDGLLHTEVFRKETSVNSVLHAASSHPRPLKDSIPYGQFLRTKRICSTESSFQTQSLELAQRFSQRGYSNRIIRRSWSKANNKPRSELLQPRNKPSTSMTVRFISTYNEKWKPMRQALSKFWPIILNDPLLAKCVPSTPSITYRRSQNLKDMLVHSQYRGKTTQNIFNSRRPSWGFFPCKRCLACSNMDKTQEFKDSQGKNIRITHNITCGTDHVVYRATCPCGLQYIGMTSRPLKIRTREHVRDIINAREASDVMSLKPIPRHFKLAHNCDSSLLRVIGIDRILKDLRGGDVRNKLAQLETQWISRLGSLQPKGLNEVMSFAPFL